MTDNEHRPPEPPQGRDPGREPDDRSRQTTLNGVPVPSSNMNDLRELKKAQTMVMVASVAGPVSLFIGGVLLSGVGLVCAIIALRKLNKLIEKRTYPRLRSVSSARRSSAWPCAAWRSLSTRFRSI